MTEEERKQKFIAESLENIHFMRAYYGHCKVYVEVKNEDAADKTIRTEDGRHLREFDLKIGVDFQLRTQKFRTLERLARMRVEPTIILQLRDWLFQDEFQDEDE